MVLSIALYLEENLALTTMYYCHNIVDFFILRGEGDTKGGGEEPDETLVLFL